jgi:hypothetical protein
VDPDLAVSDRTRRFVGCGSGPIRFRCGPLEPKTADPDLVFFARSGAEARSVSSAQKRLDERERERAREENLIRGFGDGFDCPRKQRQ